MTRPTAAARELAVARAVRGARDVVDLAAAHKQRLDRALRPVAPEPEPVDRTALRRDLEHELLARIPWWYRAERRIARERAADRAESIAREEERQRRQWHEREQAVLDEGWERLRAGEAPYVEAALERTLRECPLSARVVALEGKSVVIVLDISTLVRQLPERVPDLTPSGRPTTRKLTKTERNDFTLEILASNVLAVARRALAAAPSVADVAVAGARDGDLIYWGRFERERLSRVDWEVADPVFEVTTGAEALLDVRGRTRELRPVGKAAPPELRGVLAER